MKMVYLVDFENVHESGLYGMKLLSSEDAVFIFYTEYANRICLDCLDGVCADIHMIKVPAGKQSLDLYLASFLGYLMGNDSDPETRYVIISNDGDFNDVIHFWMNRYSMADKITRQRYIGDTGICEDPIIQPEIPQEYKPLPKLSNSVAFAE